jgi:type I restriction enzyme M protein|tara:strand:- start:1440 stop:3809 length:2370 start_codon:yes stop_codon:yes gene_type:complete
MQNEKLKKLLLKELEKSKVVKVDYNNKKIKYSDKISLERSIAKIGGDEELVRAYLVHKLSGLNYKSENIIIEREYSAGRPKTTTPRIDLILKENLETSFYFIEVKDPDKWESDKLFIEGQLFNLSKLEKSDVKYLVYYTVQEVNGKIQDKTIVIDRAKYDTYQKWTEDGQPSISNDLSPAYGKPIKIPYVKLGEKDLNSSLTSNELSALQENLHNVLWGGGGTDDREIFSSLVRIILTKIYDESITEDNKEYKFQVKTTGTKKNIEIESAEKIFEKLNTIYREALTDRLNVSKEDAKELNIIDRQRFGLVKLIYAVQQLESISFKEVGSSLDKTDIFGDFFEKILRSGFKQNKGQFFTHTNIVNFILYGLKLDELAIDLINNERRLPYIIDPSAGSGTFLIQAMQLITKHIILLDKDKLKNNSSTKDFFTENFTPKNRENRWAEKYIYGLEHHFDLGTSVKVNMILHGDGQTNIYVGEKKGDGLSPFKFYESDNSILKKVEKDETYNNLDVNNQFDVVVGNPPFSVNMSNETKRYLKDTFLFGEKDSSENLFIERYYQLLKPGGRLGIVIPESILDTNSNKYIRLFLFKYFSVKAIVSLPQLTFQPYTPTKTSILFAQKKTKEEIKNYDENWKKFSHEFYTLATKVSNYCKVATKEKDKEKLSSIKDDTDKDIYLNIKKLLGSKFIDEKGNNIEKLIKNNLNEINEILSKKNINKEHINENWVFSNVVENEDYGFLISHAENVGYKRTSRREKAAPNDLFEYILKDNQTIVNLKSEKKIINFLRENIEW